MNTMKKMVLTLVAVLCAGILFTSASPSLDGRAVVAADGVFPRGYFAKTVGYLPGDSIKVTNPVNGGRIDILVIGSLDASDGVAILLSPEAAEALSIKRNSNNMVKLTKRNGTADDVVSGSAFITKGGAEERLAEEAVRAEIEAEEIALAEDALEEIPESVIDYSEDVARAEDEAEEIGEEAAAEEIAQIEDEIPEENCFDESILLEAEIREDEIAEEIAQAEDEIPEEPFDEECAQAEDETIPEEAVDVPLEYEYVEADDILEDKENAEFSERVNEEDIPEEFAFESEPEKVDDSELSDGFEEIIVAETENQENLTEDEAEEIPELTEENSVEDEAEEDDEFAEDNSADGEEYEAIVLVPSEENPPAPREESENETEVASPDDSALTEETPALKNERSYAAATELAPRKYYVQIAVYNEAENVEEVNALYGKRYPLVVLEKGKRKTVMVGPFNVDEYGIILERFKSYGFKDAFVKSTF